MCVCSFVFYFFFSQTPPATRATGPRANNRHGQRMKSEWAKRNSLAVWLIHNKRLLCEPYSVHRERIGHTHARTYTQTCGRTLLTGIGMRAHELADSYTHTVTRTLMSERRERAGSSWISMSSGMCEWEWQAGRHLCQIKELLKRMCVYKRVWESTQACTMVTFRKWWANMIHVPLKLRSWEQVDVSAKSERDSGC